MKDKTVTKLVKGYKSHTQVSVKKMAEGYKKNTEPKLFKRRK